MRGRTALLVAVLVVSGYVLFKPGSDGALPFPQADKVVHACLFAAVAASVQWRLGTRWFVVVLAYGALSEVVQALALPHRDGDVLDVAADWAGALAGLAVASRLLAVRAPVRRALSR